VVDSFRFPYFVAKKPIVDDTSNPNNVAVTRDTDVIYSVKRLQPYRGGHFIPRSDTFTTPNAYGFSEQTTPAGAMNPATSQLQGNYLAKWNGVVSSIPVTGPIHHS